MIRKVIAILLVVFCYSTAWAGRSCNGSSDNIYFGDVALFKLTGSMTWMAYIKLNASTAFDSMIADIEGAAITEDEVDNALFFLQVKGSSGAWDLNYIHEYGAGNNEGIEFTLADIPNDTWTHVALVRDVTANTVTLFLNGTQIGGAAPYTNDPTSTATTVPYRLCTRSNQTNFFNGQIAEVALYDRALTEAEIDDIIANGQSQEPDYIHYSKLCGNESPEPDLATGNNDGTLTGTAKVTHPITGCDIAGRRSQPIFFP